MIVEMCQNTVVILGYMKTWIIMCENELKYKVEPGNPYADYCLVNIDT